MKNEMTYDETRNRLLNLLDCNNQMILTSKDGEEAKLSKSSIGKLMSEAAVKKSINNGFSRKQHYAAAAYIDKLFKISIKVLESPDKYNNPDVKAMHRFIAPIHNDIAYITIKETTEHGKRIYTIELVEIEKLEGKLEEAKFNSHIPHF